MPGFLYKERYAVGRSVCVVSKPQLQDFVRSWHLHHPLEQIQLQYAGVKAKVASVGFYHGGDVLYQLEGVPGTWHEICLTSADDGAV